MAGINAISGIATQVAAGMVTSAAKAPAAPAAGGGFGDVMKSYLDNVNGASQQAAEAVTDLMSGKTGDILPAVSAMAKADLSFKLLLGVRNKVIDAYKQTMNMQV
jgi:flagellar hook-basal body complex protein FliE